MKPICIACVVALLYPTLLAAQEKGEFQRTKDGYLEKIVRTANTGPGGFLELSAERGEIHVDTWARGEVRIAVEKEADVLTDVEARKIFADFDVYISREDNEVYISAEQEDEGESKSLRVRFKLTVPQKYRLDLQTSGGAIEIGRLNGDVRVETAGGDIKVDQLSNGLVDVETAGGNITLVGIKNGDGRARTAGGNIKVGDVSGDLEVRTAGGTIKIDRVGGDSEAETSGGSIKLGEAGGRVRAQTAGGSIHIGPVGGAVAAETSGGSIHIGPGRGAITAQTTGGSIEVRGAGGPVRATTSGGSIEIRGARSSIEAETAGGSIEAELVVADWNADTHCQLKASGGDIDLHLPANLAATVDAELKVQRKVGGDYRIYSDFPLVIKDRDSKRITGRGDINGGGDLVKLRTTNGDIHIRKFVLIGE